MRWLIFALSPRQISRPKPRPSRGGARPGHVVGVFVNPSEAELSTLSSLLPE